IQRGPHFLQITSFTLTGPTHVVIHRCCPITPLAPTRHRSSLRGPTPTHPALLRFFHAATPFTSSTPQQCRHFLPLPHGQRRFRPTPKSPLPTPAARSIT